MSRAAPQARPGMHADRGVEIGIGRPHDGSRRAAGGQPGDVDAPRIDRVVAHDLAGDAGDQRGLAPIALLVAGAEPVPALLGVGGRRLPGIDDEEVCSSASAFIRVPAAKSSGDWVQPCSMTTSGTGCRDSRSGRTACSRGSRPALPKLPARNLGPLRQRLGPSTWLLGSAPGQALRRAARVRSGRGSLAVPPASAAWQSSPPRRLQATGTPPDAAPQRLALTPHLSRDRRR